MTLSKYIILFIVLTRTCLLLSQPFSVLNEIQTLDSLIKYNEFDLVKIKADSLYTLLNNVDPTNKSLETKLELQFRKAIAYDKTYDHNLALELFFKIIDKATYHGYYKIAFLTNLAMALVYERSHNFSLCNKYLNAAYKEYEKVKSDELLYKYCIRRSSYYRFTNKLDSALFYAFQAEKLAIQNNILEDLGESNLLLGVLHNNISLLKSNEYYTKAAHFFMKVNDAHGVSVMFSNISRNFNKTGNYKRALLYSDSAYLYYKITPRYFTILLSRSEVYDKLNQADSALFYFKKYHNELMLYNAKNEANEIKK
jgi:two-component system, sensor histidine kinase PdtaS